MHRCFTAFGVEKSLEPPLCTRVVLKLSPSSSSSFQSPKKCQIYLSIEMKNGGAVQGWQEERPAFKRVAKQFGSELGRVIKEALGSVRATITGFTV